MAGQNTSNAGPQGGGTAQPKGTTEKARDMASDAADAARDHVRDQADQVKDGVAEELSDTARAFRSASSEMREGSPQERAIDEAAARLDRFAGSVRDAEFGDLVDDASGFARDNPAMFLGGATLLGLALARFGKAGGTDRSR